MKLRDKTAIVTGATGGLGWRICLALAEEGANLCMVYRNSEDKANDQLKSLQERGCNAAAVKADITTDKGIDFMTDTAVSKFGGIDMLILDAAYNERIPFEDLDSLDREKWD
jgi:3-oxoacyl-[acyl-carrier protein] reductase